MHPSQSQVERELRVLKFRLQRQRRFLETGRLDRFLSLSESLRKDFPDIMQRASRYADAEIRVLALQCKELLDGMIPRMEKALIKIKGEGVRTEIERKIREFLAKKEEP